MVRRFWFIGIQYTYVNIICLSQAWVQLLEMTILEAIDWIGWWWWWWNWPMKKDFTTANVWTYSWWFVDRYWGSIFHFLTDRKEESMVMMTIRHFQCLLSRHQTNTGWYITPLMIMYQYKFYENINSEIQNFYINSIYKYH